MLIEKLLLLLIVYINLAKAQREQTLGPNLIINHDFSTPNISSMGATQVYFVNSILGWNCSSNC